MFNWLRKFYFSKFCNCKFGKGVYISPNVNIYGAELGENVFIGPFCEIQEGCYIGDNTRISSHTFLAAQTKIGKNCFISHGVITCNDKKPLANDNVWKLQGILIDDGVSIGSGVVICPGVSIFKNVLVGAGAVVTKNIPSGETWIGIPAKSVEIKDKTIGFNK